MRDSKHGFTLFEVLGAVALLAIVYTSLSGTAIFWLRSEGQSRRTLEASLIADWELSEFEMELDTGVAPEIGFTESEADDGIRVTWDVTPLETPIYKDPSAPNTVGQGQNTAQQDENARLAQARARARSTADGVAPAFLKVELRVSWMEANEEHAVTRTIFAVDEDAAAKLAAASVLSGNTSPDQEVEEP
jgi:hypothetical protein